MKNENNLLGYAFVWSGSDIGVQELVGVNEEAENTCNEIMKTIYSNLKPLLNQYKAKLDVLSYTKAMKQTSR